jgi:hypothetical protein
VPDDLRAVAALLGGQTMCRDCLAQKTDLPRWKVDDAIQRLGAMVKTSEQITQCDSCRKLAVVYTLP